MPLCFSTSPYHIHYFQCHHQSSTLNSALITILLLLFRLSTPSNFPFVLTLTSIWSLTRLLQPPASPQLTNYDIIVTTGKQLQNREPLQVEFSKST
jgi:hypothetical protein